MNRVNPLREGSGECWKHSRTKTNQRLRSSTARFTKSALKISALDSSSAGHRNVQVKDTLKSSTPSESSTSNASYSPLTPKLPNRAWMPAP
jgi:hypothetical protein